MRQERSSAFLVTTHMKIKSIIRIGFGIGVLLVGAILLAACAARVRQGDFSWLPTALFGMTLLFIGYGMMNKRSLKEILLDIVATLTGKL